MRLPVGQSLWVPLVVCVASACEDSKASNNFSSFAAVRSAALKLGCVEYVRQPPLDGAPDWRNKTNYFECDREMGPSCECRVTLTLRGDIGQKDQGVHELEVENSFCPRATGSALAYDLLAAAIGQSHRAAVADFVVGPPAGSDPRHGVSRFRTFGDVDLYVRWTPVRHTSMSQAVDPTKSESMHIRLFPRLPDVEVDRDPPIQLRDLPRCRTDAGQGGPPDARDPDGSSRSGAVQ